jgi:hypothetical protein
MPEENRVLSSEQQEKCQRWRKIAIDQLSYTLNLTLTFTIAALGFWFALLKDTGFTPASQAKCAFWVSLFALVLSVLVGFICALGRLWDFRGTARRACKYPKAQTKGELRELGDTTWVLFYLQLGAFGLGVVTLAAALLQTYGSKLL